MASIARSDQPNVADDGALALVIAGIERALQTSRGVYALLTLLSLALFLPGFFTLQPMDRDEPRFAQASKQMVETGDYVVRFCEVDIGLINRRSLFTRFAPPREGLRDPAEQTAQPNLSGIMPV